MPKYAYIVVEGPHDVEFVYRLIKPFGFKRIRMHDDLDEYFQGLVPRTFPHGGDLQKRVPVPLFLKNESHVLAVHSAIGDSRLVGTVEENQAVIDFSKLVAIGLILDTDREIQPSTRYADIAKGFKGIGLKLPSQAGTVAKGAPHIGAFVLPDNATIGNLEDLLIECAEVAYPSVLALAQEYVSGVASTPPEDGEDLSKTPARNKAIVGSIANVLRPGKAVQVSIQDNRWFHEDGLKVDRVKAVQKFLIELLELVA